MGLDMYLIGKKYFWHSETPRMEDDFEVKEVEIRLGYWRKHPNLHGYIVEEFANGEDNCQEISLDATRIARIIKAVETNDLPHTDGFFFGDSAHYDGTEAEQIAVFQKALKWLETKEEGVSRDIKYQASW